MERKKSVKISKDEILGIMLTKRQKIFTSKLEEIKKILEDNPRIHLTDVADKLGLPLSTIFDNMKRLFEVYELKGYFIKRKKK